MPSQTPAQALIVGAGPVGLALAIELTRFGLPVRILDKAAARSDKSKALVIWPRTLELLARAGCDQALIAAGNKAIAANIVAGASQLARIALDDVTTPYPYALMIPQSDTERILEEHLLSLGVTVERNTTLTTFTASDTNVTASLQHPDQTEETLTLPWLIGCDGAHSTVRHHLGSEFTGDTLPSDWVLADVHLTGLPHAPDVNVFWHTSGVLITFPISATRFRVIADVGNGTGRQRPDPTLDEIQAIIDQRGPHADGGSRVLAFDPIWLANFRINERKVADYRSGRVFLAGDAAHIHSPAGGQGMNTGIQDAINLAWKLALVTHGHAAPEPLLSSYSPERSAVGDQVLKAAGNLTAVGILRGSLQQSVRNHLISAIFGLSSVRHLAAETITELSIGYPHSPLNGPHHGGPIPGSRAPIRPNDSPIGSGDTPRFALCASPSPDADTLLQRYTRILEPTLRQPFDGTPICLIRPDGYVALTTRHWHEVETCLQAIAPARL